MEQEIILASASPRRKELLASAGISFTVVPAEVEEWMDERADPEELVCQNAKAKAMAVAQNYSSRVVLGADTVVVLDGLVLGKPTSRENAIEMLSRLAGKTHMVATGVALCQPTNSVDVFCVRSHVTFRQLDLTAIEEYITVVNVMDKAGAYAVQEKGEQIIQKIKGSVTNVIGLPMEELLPRLEKWGFVCLGGR